jgi:hypothetical protein
MGEIKMGIKKKKKIGKEEDFCTDYILGFCGGDIRVFGNV